jgi:hypothetical protein
MGFIMTKYDNIQEIAQLIIRIDCLYDEISSKKYDINYRLLMNNEEIAYKDADLRKDYVFTTLDPEKLMEEFDKLTEELRKVSEDSKKYDFFDEEYN